MLATCYQPATNCDGKPLSGEHWFWTLEELEERNLLFFKEIYQGGLGTISCPITTSLPQRAGRRQVVLRVRLMPKKD